VLWILYVQQVFICKERVLHCKIFIFLFCRVLILFSLYSEVQAFSTEHSVKQAIENIDCIRSKLKEVLPGGEKLIKGIYLKSTDSISIPIFINMGISSFILFFF
jgi:hypothetical protein